eukprot:EG_transcript_10161
MVRRATLCSRLVFLHTALRRTAASVAERDSRFASLQPEDLTAFHQLVPDGVVTAPDDLARYNADWLNQWHGSAQVALRPSSTEQVSAILKYCNNRRLAVCPQGGNTGLVGGSIPVHDEVVLSLERLRQITKFDEVSGVLVCGAGCILEALDNFLAEKGFMMPLDLGAKGSCQIGGNVSTNAGGLRYLRYGSLHQNVLGLKAVLADGTVVDQMNELRKDNTGYDLKQLFIGSEGTLGIITELCINVPVKPNSTSVALLACPTFVAVQETFVAAKRHLAEVLSAVEFMDARSVQSLLEVTGAAFPISTDHPFYMVIETQGSNAEHDQTKLHGFLEAVMAQGCVADGTVAQSGTEARALWELREGVSPAMSKKGYTYKYDLSLPVGKMYDIVEAMRQRLVTKGRQDALVHGFGHLGDGNIHMNIVSPTGQDPELGDLIEPFVYEWTRDQNGSVSAEHGIGQMKRKVLHMSKRPSCLELMKQVKTLLDPNGILNPYKVLP